MDRAGEPLTAPAGPVAGSVVLLWHGRGPNEAHVMGRLAQALRSEGHVVVTPDWDSGAADRGAGALLASLEQCIALAAGPPAKPLVVAGWSLGGKAAVSLALDAGTAGRVAGVVGLAARFDTPSPLDGAVPLELLRQGVSHQPPPIHLVHGRQDTVVPPEASEQFADACRAAGIRCALSMVDSDHAGVVGTAYDTDLRICVPDDGPAATTGMTAALEAIRAAVASSGPVPSRQTGTAIQ